MLQLYPESQKLWNHVEPKDRPYIRMSEGEFVARNTLAEKTQRRDENPSPGFNFGFTPPAKPAAAPGPLNGPSQPSPLGAGRPGGFTAPSTDAIARVKANHEAQEKHLAEAQRKMGGYIGTGLEWHPAGERLFTAESTAPNNTHRFLLGTTTPEKGMGGTLGSGEHLHGKVRLYVFGDPKTGEPTSWSLYKWLPTGKK